MPPEPAADPFGLKIVPPFVGSGGAKFAWFKMLKISARN
jgi:hypothetical protein